MKKESLKEVAIKKNNFFFFPEEDKPGDMLIIGNFDGFLGDIEWKPGKSKSPYECFTEDMFDEFAETFERNLGSIMSTLNSGHKIVLAASEGMVGYFKRLIYSMYDLGWIEKNVRNIYAINIDAIYSKSNTEEEFVENLFKDRTLSNMKFDYIIQNPPYSGSLHLDFLDKGLDLLKKDGKMVIIEPATWLINVRKNGKAKKYDAIKKRIEGHVESVAIENLNKDFGVTQSMPFATTTIDMSQTFPIIEFTCCGEKRRDITTIYDCNLIGEYKNICSIFGKVKNFGDMMVSHITNEDKGRDIWYAKCVGIGKDSLISGAGAALCAATNERVGMTYDSEVLWCKTKNGNYLIPYTSIGYHYYKNNVSNEPLRSYDRGKKITDKIAWNVFGTKSEVENWKYFVFNNKLPLFLNICLTYNQHNNSVDYLPWLVDKQYTDDEINEMFGFTDDEIELINKTIKKYERNSPWFKRYMCGPDSVSDEEVNNFIESL